MKKYSYLLTGTLLASGLLGNAAAATVQFTTANPIIVSPGETFTLTLEGKDFSAPADGGGFTFDWDDSVLKYVSTSVFSSPWDTNNVNDTDALAQTSNKVDFVLVGTSGAAQGPDFVIADITFNFIGNAGDSSPINLADALGGWATTGAVPIDNVSYINAEVSAVPLPSAILLFASGVMGLGLFKKSRHSSTANES